MEGKINCFTQLPDAVVPITGIRMLKDYLEKVVPVHEAMPVCRFTTFGDEVFVHVLNHERGRVQKKFFGFIEDVALNAQRGLYEERGKHE